MKALSTSFAIGLAAMLLGGASANAGLVYLDDSAGQLFAGDPTTHTYNLVGTDPTAAAFGGFTDIAFTANGNLYGLGPAITGGSLYQIDPNTGLILADLGSTGITDGSLVGLAGDATGILVAGGANAAYAINPAVSPIPYASGGGGGYATEGDLDFTDPAHLYLTSAAPNPGELFSIATNGVGTDLGQLQDGSGNAFGDVFGVAYDSDNGILYGFDVAGTQFDINTSDPTHSGGPDDVSYNVIGEAGGASLLGATFIATPEPGSVSMILLGLGSLGFGLMRRRKS